MKEHKQYKFSFSPYLEKLYQSDKPLIIYKMKDGYNIYTDFSKKIILNKGNINNFLNFKNLKKKNKELDLFIGFFSYETFTNMCLTCLYSMLCNRLQKERRETKTHTLFVLRHLRPLLRDLCILALGHALSFTENHTV